MLLSELIEGDLNREVTCEIVAKNSLPEQKEIYLDATGCTCYGVWLDDYRFETGNPIPLGPSESLSLTLKAQAPNHEAEQGYRADFSIPQADGTRRKVTLESHFNVYQDLKVNPVVMTCETEPGEDKLLQRTVRVERIFRSPQGVSPAPQLQAPPDGVEVERIVPVEAPQQLEENLWKAAWDIALSIQVAGDISQAGTQEDLTFQFDPVPDIPDSASTSIVTELNRKLNLPINSPAVVHFGRLKTGETRERTVFIKAAEDRQFQLIVDKTTLPGNIQVELANKSDSSHRVTVNLTADDRQDPKQTLHIQTDLKEQPLLEIELLWFLETSAD